MRLRYPVGGPAYRDESSGRTGAKPSGSRYPPHVVRSSMPSPRARMALLALAICVSLGAPQAASASDVVSSRVLQQPADVFDYWTQARMDAALPAVPISTEGPLDGIGDVLGGGGETDGASRRGPAKEIRDPKRAKLRSNGKVFFSEGVSDFVCSGTVVKSKTKSLVVTAGHCSFSGGTQVSNFMFVPAKDGDREPFGRWSAKRLATTPQWQSSDDVRYDVGMATMAKRNGKKLQNVVGARGITFNRGGNQRFRAFGYPQGPPFGGKNLFVCKSPQEGTDSRMSQPRPGRIDCNMTGGSSGGGWLVGKGKVNSVVSYGYECPGVVIIVFPCDNPEDGKLFGPYFGNEIKKLYRSQKR